MEGSDGTLVSMFSCRAMILGYIGIVGTLPEIDSIHPDPASPSSKLHAMYCSYHVKVVV